MKYNNLENLENIFLIYNKKELFEKEFFTSNFKNSKIENKFQKTIIGDNNILILFTPLPILYIINLILLTINFNYNFFSIIYIIAIITDILYSFLIYKKKFQRILKFIKIFTYYIISIYWIVSLLIQGHNVYRYFINLYISINFLYLIYLDQSLLLIFLIMIINLSITLGLRKFNLFSFEEFIIIPIYSFLAFIIKKVHDESLRRIYVDQVKYEKCYNYIKEIIEIGFIYLTLKNKIPILYSDNLKKIFKYINQNTKFNSTCMETSDMNILEDGSDKDVNYLLSILRDEKGSGLFEFINTLDDKYFENFYNMGEYSLLKNKYEIFIRKKKYNQDIIELVLNDINKKSNNNTLHTHNKSILNNIANQMEIPINSITGILAQIKEKALINNYLRQIESSIDNIQGLSYYIVYMIMDSFDPSPVDMSYLNIKEILLFCYDVLNSLLKCNEIKIKNIKTSIDVDNRINTYMIYSDENKLKQILLNLILNSVKNTKTGYIRITSIIENNRIKISISDSSIGILQEAYDYRLSLVSELSKLLNHKFEINSKVNYGSVANIIINKNERLSNFNEIGSINNEKSINLTNLVINEKDAFINSEISGDSFDLCKSTNTYEVEKIDLNRRINTYSDESDIIEGRILIIDDNVYSRLYIRKNLENVFRIYSKNYIIQEYNDGIDILNNIICGQDVNSIKCIFTDEQMEYVNGSQAIKLIRDLEKENKIKKIKICSILAFEDIEYKEKLFNNGADYVILNKSCKGQIEEFLKKFNII